MANKHPSLELRAYRINDFCRAYGFSRTTVYELIAAGTLRCLSAVAALFLAMRPRPC
jgi:hypothetical protein